MGDVNGFIYNNVGKTVTFSGGVKVTAYARYLLNASGYKADSFVISDAELTNTNTDAPVAIRVHGGSDSGYTDLTKITGGTVNGNISINAFGGGKLQISGGTVKGEIVFDGEGEGALEIIGGMLDGSYTCEHTSISGGTFTEDPSADVSTGYEAVYDSATELWTVQEKLEAPDIASVTIGEETTLYKTFDAAMNAAIGSTAAATVKVLADCETAGGFVTGTTNAGGITIDTNGFTVTVTGAQFIHSKVTLVIGGAGSITGTSSTANNNGFIYNNIGKTMTFKDGVAIRANARYLLNASGYLADSFEIKDADLENTNTASTAYTIRINGGSSGYSGTSTISAGTVMGRISVKTEGGGKLVVTGGTFTIDPTPYVNTANYQVDENGDGTFTVNEKAGAAQTVTNSDTGAGYTTLDAAVAALTGDGQRLVVTDDFDLGADYAVSSAPYAFVLDLGGKTLTGDKTSGAAAITVTDSAVTIVNGTIKVQKGNVNRAAVSPMSGASVTLGEGLTVSGSSTKSNGYGITGTGNATARLIVDGAVIDGADSQGRAIYVANGGNVEVRSGEVRTVIHVYNGSLSVWGGSFHAALTQAGSGVLSLSGGLYGLEPDAGFIADGYVVTDNTDASTSETFPYTVIEDH